MSDPRTTHNEAFYERLLRRRSQDAALYRERLQPPVLEGVGDPLPPPSRAAVLETLVDEERPVLFVKQGALDYDDATILGPEAKDLIDLLRDQERRVLSVLPLIGRVDVENFPGSPFVGTGWLIAEDIVVTNRHVASLIARPQGRQFVFATGIGGQRMVPSWCTAHEHDDVVSDQARVHAVTSVLYIEPDDGPHDIALLRVQRHASGSTPRFVELSPVDLTQDDPLCTIGYPARAPRHIIPNQDLMERLFRGRYDVKRVAPGYGVRTRNGQSEHDCTTLGGNSGSVVLNLRTGLAVGLHYAGRYMEANYAVSAGVLTDYMRRQVWQQGPEIAGPQTVTTTVAPTATPVLQAASTAHTTTLSWTLEVPVTLTVTLGAPVVKPAGPTGVPPVTDPSVAVREWWPQRPEGVLAARVGYFDADGEVGTVPFIAASVLPSRLVAIEAAGPRSYAGLPIRYLPASPAEQIEAWPELEAGTSIRYDDDARTGPEFSWDEVDEQMDIILHVGPEYSWDVLKTFLSGVRGSMVSAMYEFHGREIMETIEERLEDGAVLTLLVDKETFDATDTGTTFDAQARFSRWTRDYGDRFAWISVPGGGRGLVSRSYHIKVSVRSDDTFWLSSGNWKQGSSQPLVTDADRANATSRDLRGNREWHVVVHNATLAGRLRAHLLQDERRSRELKRSMPESAPAAELVELVELPTRSVVPERAAPSCILAPRTLNGHRARVRPLLTPDRQGAVYCDAVLELIRSARQRLLFQIPYIGMPPNPTRSRGYIDALIDALTDKLKTLPDARVLLRSDGTDFSAPAHAAWFFQSRGVDIHLRVHQIEDHHTKGMIVDDRRVLLGSHNWSQTGVTLNRDASLLFEDDAVIAAYYTEAFEIDWARSHPIRAEEAAREAVSESTGGGVRFVRVPWSEGSEEG